jgi:general secretion pathway protein E
MIGEIRDLETAQIAVQASLTGHLVLATLHTNDAASAVTRLIDMGVEPFLLASTLRGVLAQRLVRRLCPACRSPSPPATPTAPARPRHPAQLWRAPAAPPAAAPATPAAPASTSSSPPTTPSSASSTPAPTKPLRAHARAHGAHSLRDDGLRLLAEGATSAEELLRVTRE